VRTSTESGQLACWEKLCGKIIELIQRGKEGCNQDRGSSS